ncbi:PAS domain S-box protein [Melioribacteraceae bacterium 4301-Me]|uniref:PAS domain S-box protein n=1 Tax=Pyranulibacter aquaticus TaxID=3163344 RepID=UPI0035975693
MEQILKPEEFLKVIASFLTETHSGLAIIDVKHSLFPFVYVNRGFSKITGYASNEIIGREFGFFLDIRTRNNLITKITAILEKPESFSIDTKIVSKGGKIIDALILFTPVVSYPKDIEHIFLIVDDITDKKARIANEASLKTFKVTIESVNDIVFNYMNYLKVFRDDLLEVNGQINHKRIEELIAEYDVQYRNTFMALTKFESLTSFKTKSLTDDLEIFDL